MLAALKALGLLGLLERLRPCMPTTTCTATPGVITAEGASTPLAGPTIASSQPAGIGTAPSWSASSATTCTARSSGGGEAS